MSLPLKPKTRTDYERIKPDEWISGTIQEIEHDETRETEFKGEKKVVDSIRFVFKLEGYQYAHKSRWMGFSYHKKATLFNKYLASLVDNIHPNMDFNLRDLVGLPIKTMWSQNGEWDNVEMIRPLGKKLSVEKLISEDTSEEINESEDVPF